MNKIGLVLEGGAMRGLFSAGIMDVMMENHLFPAGIAGVSAGAAFGCNFKSQQIGRALRYNKRFSQDKRYCSFRSWLLTGDLFGAKFCYHTLPDELDKFDKKTFAANPMEFFLVCTNVHTGQAHYQQCMQADFECYEWMRASASMPLVSRVVKIGAAEYLDGALADAIPLKFMEKQGYEKNIVILTQPPDYRKPPQRGLPLFRLLLRRYPQLIKVIEQRHKIYNETLDYIANQMQKGNIFLMQPEKPLPSGRICHDADLLQQTYDIGRVQAIRHLKQLKEFLQQ